MAHQPLPCYGQAGSNEKNLHLTPIQQLTELYILAAMKNHGIGCNGYLVTFGLLLQASPPMFGAKQGSFW